MATISSSYGFMAPRPPMPRGVYRSEPASRLGRWSIGTIFDLVRPRTSTQPPLT